MEQDLLQSLEKEWEIKQEKLINQIQDLNECFGWLQNNVIDYKIFAVLEENKAIAMAHFILGKHIRNQFELWKYCEKPIEKRNPIVKWFNKIGIYHPDDMSSIILTSWHRELNGKKLEIKGQVKKYREHWEEYNPKVNEGKL